MSITKRIPAYYKAAIVGTGLMFMVVAVVAIGYSSIGATYRSAEAVVYGYYPARDQILFIDRDLHQAQLAMERAILAVDALDRDAQITAYQENVGQTIQRFNAFQEQTASLTDPLSLKTAYLNYREIWTRSGEQLIGEMKAGRPIDELTVHLKRIAEHFVDMRYALDRINEATMAPLLQLSSEQLTTQARDSQRIVLATLVIALLLGTWLTMSGVGAIRAQYATMLAERDTREQEAKRKELDRRIQRALELVQTEEAALGVVSHALNEVAMPSHQAEVLLADSGVAHLRRVAGTEQIRATGCSVVEPHECPAIRRNSRMSFPSSAVFDCCPYLWKRSERGCSAVCIPVSIMGRTAGVLHTVGPPGVLPTANQDEALHSIASRAGDVIGVIRAFASKERQTSIDALADLWNRRSADVQHGAEAGREDDNAGPTSSTALDASAA
jgi:hypothetical protein